MNVSYAHRLGCKVGVTAITAKTLFPYIFTNYEINNNASNCSGTNLNNSTPPSLSFLLFSLLYMCTRTPLCSPIIYNFHLQVIDSWLRSLDLSGYGKRKLQVHSHLI